MTHVEHVNQSEFNTLNLGLDSLESRGEVDGKPLADLLGAHRQIGTIGVLAGHVRRQSVVVSGPFDSDELVILFLERN